MAEYAKIETAMVIICDLCGSLYPDGYFQEKCGLGKCDWMEYLKENAADVTPVVHCKDCRYWGDADGISTNVDGVRFARCRAHNHYVAGMHIGWCTAGDDFCSYGARMGGDSGAE